MDYLQENRRLHPAHEQEQGLHDVPPCAPSRIRSLKPIPQGEGGGRHWSTGEDWTGTRILGVDTGVHLGVATICLDENMNPRLCHIGFFNLTDPHASQVQVVRSAAAALVLCHNMSHPTMVAIETPVVGRAISKSIILQSRMLQELVNITTVAGSYREGFSEVNPSSSRAVILQSGDYKARGKGKLKKIVVERVIERFGIDRHELEAQITEREVRAWAIEAMCDAVTVTLAMVRSMENSGLVLGAGPRLVPDPSFLE